MFQLCNGQLDYRGEDTNVQQVQLLPQVGPSGAMQMAALTGLNVSCEPNGMTVRLEFDQPFNGIVYSKGYYDDPKCR